MKHARPSGGIRGLFALLTRNWGLKLLSLLLALVIYHTIKDGSSVRNGSGHPDAPHERTLLPTG